MPTPDAVEPKAETEEKPKPRRSRAKKIKSLMIELPISEIEDPNEYLTRHIDVHLKTDSQKQGLRRLRNGLTRAKEKLENGKFVESNVDVVRWLLESIES
ncbi:MAG: hypothetical protein ACI9G1_005676 [Pirellulaceae bacterium]|jgi:hypothetical protein